MGYDDLVQEGKKVIKYHLKDWPALKDGTKTKNWTHGPYGEVDYQTYTTWRNKVKKYVSENDPSNFSQLAIYFEVFEKDFNSTAFAELMSFLEVDIKRVGTEDEEDESNGDTHNNHKVNWTKWCTIVAIITCLITFIALLISSDLRDFIQSLHP